MLIPNKSGRIRPFQRKLSLVKYLVSMGASPNARDIKGNTPLHLMAERGYLEGVKFLTESSLVDVNLQNNEGLIALHVAVESGFSDVVKVRMINFIKDEIKNVKTL